MEGFKIKSIKRWCYGRMMVASTLLFCSAQVAALHSVINVPGGAYYDPIYYPFDPPTIPNVITYANYGASGLGVGGIISGTFGLVYPYNSVYNYSADIDSLYAPNFTLEYSGTIATVMDSTNVFIGDGSVGPATDFYTSGFTSRISHGTVSHDGYEYSQQYTGLLELTPLGITDFISPFGDMGMQIIFDFDKQRIDFIAPNTNRNNSILSFFGGGTPRVTADGFILLATTQVVPLPGAVYFMITGLGVLMGFGRMHRPAIRQIPSKNLESSI